ncbi:hypothetical protein QYF61_009328 [Mycteria americana]|uniref:Uncharacterized protein n=1 Tax=Mycteria americana TaxID=33587 RepID=A0AAN7NTA7_MYCAM|nr:hypothetical protein QYF61_009328 [Mycteria americana]
MQIAPQVTTMQGHLPLDQVAQSPIQPGLKHFQGGAIHNFSGQPVPAPFKYWKAAIRSPQSLLFSRLKNPNNPEFSSSCALAFLIPSLHSWAISL